MFILGRELLFPPVDQAGPEGLLALGGDLSPKRLEMAYRSGIFPWYSEGQPLMWWSPDPRMVLFPESFKVSKSLKRLLAKGAFRVTYNEQFEQVIQQCATVPRRGQSGTWITPEMQDAYINLHRKGLARSWEVWMEGRLAGGLYGVDLPDLGVFCGESMFSLVSNASKVAFYHLVRDLRSSGYRLIDCQQPTEHLRSLGAETISREAFLSYLVEDKT